MVSEAERYPGITIQTVKLRAKIRVGADKKMCFTACAGVISPLITNFTPSAIG